MHSSEPMTLTGTTSVFADEVAALNGSVTDRFDDGRRVYLRAVLKRCDEVRSGDRVQAGVALRCVQRDVLIHPYVFRLLCRNGIIVRQVEDVQCLAGLIGAPTIAASVILRDTVRACCAPEAFDLAARQMRAAVHVRADRLRATLDFFARFTWREGGRTFDRIRQRFNREGDDSAFGLMNAVTSVARDTDDPRLKWDLEEFGGAIAARCLPKPPTLRPASMRLRQNVDPAPPQVSSSQ